MKHSEYITKEYFQQATHEMKQYIDLVLKATVREIIAHLNASQGEQNKRIDELSTDMKEVKSDVAELKTDMKEVKRDVSQIQVGFEDYLHTDRTVVTIVEELSVDHNLPKTLATMKR